MPILIKRRCEYCYISGTALREQRQAAKLSLRNLADLIKKATGNDYIVVNGAVVALNKMTICRIEKSYEAALEYVTARIIQKILS